MAKLPRTNVNRRSFNVLMAATAASTLFPSQSSAQNQADNEQSERTIRTAVADFGSESLDPIVADRATTFAIILHMYDTLLELGPNSELMPGVAESWEVDNSGLVWTFNLRKGIQFHEEWGELTSADVAYSIQRFMSDLSRSSGGAIMRLLVDRIDEVDKYTLNIHLKEPAPSFPYFLSPHQSDTGMIFSKRHLIEGAGDDFEAQSKLIEQNPIGSGPFRFVSRQYGNSYTYEALPHHWRNTPRFKGLEILLVPETATQMAMLRTGEVDIISVSGDQIAEAEAAGLQVHRVPGALNVWVNFTGTYRPAAQGKPTTDVRVRKALSLAINRGLILETVLAGYGNLPITPLNTTPATADLNPDDYKEWAAEISKYDPEEARRLLAEAGYPEGFSGLQLFSYTRPGMPFLPKLAEIIAAQWAEVGVEANIVAMDFGSYREHYVKADINDALNAGDAGTHGGGPRFDAIGGFINNWLYKGGHIQLLNDPKVDEGILRAATQTDAAERRELVRDVMNRVNDSWVGQPLFDIDALFAVNPGTVAALDGYPGWPFLGRVYETLKVA